MQLALRKPFVVPNKEIKKSKKSKINKAPRTSRLFNVVMIIVIACFSIALLRVVQYALFNQYALENEQLQQKIANEEQMNQELSSQKLALESPQRIESIAKGKLKMVRPNNVRYLVFKETKPNSQLAYAKIGH